MENIESIIQVKRMKYLIQLIVLNLIFTGIAAAKSDTKNVKKI